MRRKFRVGQRVGVNVKKLINNPHHTSFLSHHGSLGTVTALHDVEGKGAGELQVYEVRLDTSGNITLVVPEDALVAAR